MTIDHTDVVNKPGYRIQNPKKLAAMQFIIEDLLNKGIIKPAQSPYSSPALLVPKKHNAGETNIHKLWRFVSDYRALNAVTVTDNYRPPPIDLLLHSTAGAKYFSFLDLEKGFWQLGIDEESQPATAFTVPGIGVYQFTRVVMGLKTQVQSFNGTWITRWLAYCFAFASPSSTIFVFTARQSKSTNNTSLRFFNGC